jgi:hypothetical protein
MNMSRITAKLLIRLIAAIICTSIVATVNAGASISVMSEQLVEPGHVHIGPVFNPDAGNINGALSTSLMVSAIWGWYAVTRTASPY